MPVIDLEIVRSPSTSKYKDQFVVELQFMHDDDSITENEEVVFEVSQKTDVIEFINAMDAADEFLAENCREPEEGEDDEEIVAIFDKWLNYSKPGLSSWPTDSNGNYYANLDDVTVVYYDAAGIRFEVEQVEA